MVPFALLGNKVDLCLRKIEPKLSEGIKEVSTEKGKELADKYGAIY